MCAAFFRNTFQSWGPYTPSITTFMMELELEKKDFEIPSFESEFLFLHLSSGFHSVVRLWGCVWSPTGLREKERVFFTAALLSMTFPDFFP